MSILAQHPAQGGLIGRRVCRPGCKRTHNTTPHENTASAVSAAHSGRQWTHKGLPVHHISTRSWGYVVGDWGSLWA